MLSFTTHDLKENPQFIQQQAEIEPVIIANSTGKQILINYNDYLDLINKNTATLLSKSAYDYFNTTLKQHFTQEELQILADIEDDADMSAVGQF